MVESLPQKLTALAAPVPSPRRRVLAYMALLWLALAQVLWAGYRLGAGNQSIQIPFLQHAVHPNLYARDAMVSQTLAAYPSYFFNLLAVAARHVPLTHLYFWLHLLTALAVLAAAAGLARGMFADRRAGLLVVLLFFAGHHHALAGEDLYSGAFTHTWAVFPLAIVAMLFFYRGWALVACALVGALFNLHALIAAYLAIMFIACAACERGNWKLILYVAALFLPAFPTLHAMFLHRQVFDAQWIQLTRLRSADHSFPSTWWQGGTPDLPRFTLLLAMGALSLGFKTSSLPTPGQSGTPRRPGSSANHKTLLLTAAVGLMFFAGYVFADLYPVPIILRAQLFRSSLLLLVILFCHIAYGISCGLRLGRLEKFNAIAALLCLSIPPLLPLLPYVVLLGALTALYSGRLAWPAATAVGAALLLCAIARWRIHFQIPGVDFSWWTWTAPAGGALAWLALTAVLATLATARWLKGIPARIATVLLLIALPVVAFFAYHAQTTALRADPWMQAQLWARDHTDPAALFLTPPAYGGFRIGSQRAVVGEWRDGTQLYFSAAFAPIWWKRMTALEPDLIRDSGGSTLLAHGRRLELLSDAELLDLCGQFKADYIVVTLTSEPRGLKEVYANAQWAIYEPQPRQEPQDQDPGEKFMQQVVWPNIEKYRKSDARVQIVDSVGRPIHAMPYAITQVSSDFKWSSSLNFFKVPATRPKDDFKPGQVQPQELERFGELFNASLIPYSGKWMYVEPEEGKCDYADLDAYVDWCTSRGLSIEYHFLSGYEPKWVLDKKPASVQGQLFLKHACDVVQRYKGRIAFYQVVNEERQLAFSPAVFAEVRKIDPQAKFGISDCTSFWISHPGRQKDDQSRYAGIKDVEWLKTQGVQLDFFSCHGHAPYGVWPTGPEIYAAFDAFARLGVRVHISEFAVPLGKPVLGPGHGPGREVWNTKNQAEFYAWFFTVCFSHPDVDWLNLWDFGPDSWWAGAGLLDEHFQPKPDWTALHELIKQRFMTHLGGSLPLDGAVDFRGFQGGYQIELTLSEGNVAKASFEVHRDAANQVRLVLQDGHLTIAEP
jgi:endo-1,4-beta-xylanase